MNRFDEGISTLEGGIAREDADRRWVGRMQIALGELYARARRWEEAADALEVGAPSEGEADIAARAFVLLGQVEEHLERFEDAAEAYRMALRQKPAYELSFAAEVGRALVLGLDTDRADEALTIIRRMRGDDKHYQRRAELALIEARLRAHDGQSPAALALYRDVLYDEELGGGAVRGEAHYRLSEFYRDVLDDYVLASAHLDSAATMLRSTLDDRPIARGAVLDVADEARTYSGLATSARRLTEVDSLMTLGALSEEEFRARIEVIEAERRRVYIEEQRRIEAERRAQEFSGGGTGFDSRTEMRAPPPGDAPVANAGFLSFRSPSSVQSGLISFQQRWGDRPLVPNWRRRASIQAGAVAVGRGTVGNTIDGGLGLTGGPPPLDLFNVPRTPAKRNEMVVEMAGLRYELANAFFLQLGQADTAAALYRSILEDTPALPVAVRARYALAEIERAAGRDDVARPLYQSVLETDSLALGQASRERLGLPPIRVEGNDLEDGLAGMYDAARARWQAGDPLGGAADLIQLADRDADHPTAPRAYLAAAVAFLDWAGADSLAQRGPLPDSLISTVLFDAASRASDEQLADSLALPPPADLEVEQPVLTEPDVLEEVPTEPDVLEVVPSAPTEPDVSEGDPSEEPEDAPVEQRAPGAPAQVSGDAAAQTPVEVPTLEEDLPVLEDERTSAPEATPADSVVIATPETSDLEAVESSVVPGSSGVTVADHLRAVAERYPSTPFAERAAMLAVELTPIPVVAPLAPLDSSATPGDIAMPGDVATPGPMTALDSTLAARRALEDQKDVNLAGLRGADRLDPDLSGFTWKVRTLSIPDEGTPTIEVLQEAGFRAAILQELETRAYIIAIGQFETEDAARSVTDDLPAWARFRGEIVRIDAFVIPAVNDDL